jgi:uncharacterized secreted protein with C-terminal beta-propeller domain
MFRISISSRTFWSIAVVGGVASVFLLVVFASALVNRGSSLDYAYNKFDSCSDLAVWLNKQPSTVDYFDNIARSTPVPEVAADGAESGRGSYSQTNVQVAGVDEADVVKTDGKYIYSLSDNAVHITDVQDPSALEIVSTIKFQSPQYLFVSDDKLVVFGGDSLFYPYPLSDRFAPDIWPSYRSQTVISIYDISDRMAPALTRSLKFDGNYTTARLLDGVVYVVASYYPERGYGNGDLDAADAEALLPRIADISGSGAVKEADFVRLAECNEVAHYGSQGGNFSIALAVDLDAVENNGSEVMVGDSGTVYMSRNNLYIASTVYPTQEPSQTSCTAIQELLNLCSSLTIAPPLAYEDPETHIYSLKVDGTEIEFSGKAKVAGTLLNQFSLDENSGYLRVATTEGQTWTGTSSSGVHVIAVEDMVEVGSVTDLAPGESIYAARFIGERAYLVTFRQVDPLYVIDLSVPQNPEVLGELKIPGYSNYLHPYDENHLLGFGRDADEDIGIVEGLKFALFDVSDPANPVELDKEIIGDRSVDSAVLQDHKALLFDRERELMVIPYADYGSFRDISRDFDNLFIVYNVNLEDGIVERLRIKQQVHGSSASLYGINQRSLYIGDTLFLHYGNRIDAYNLNSLSMLDGVNVTD